MDDTVDVGYGCALEMIDVDVDDSYGCSLVMIDVAFDDGSLLSWPGGYLNACATLHNALLWRIRCFYDLCFRWSCAFAVLCHQLVLEGNIFRL